MSDLTKTAILHVALNPYTGTWSVMRDLARAQTTRNRYAGVGIGVIVDSRWPQEYREQMASGIDHHFEGSTPKIFGTASSLYQRLHRPNIESWVNQLAEATHAQRIVVHFHNAWITGNFLPLRATQVPTSCISTFHGVNEDFEGQPVRKHLHRGMAQRLLRVPVTLTSVDTPNLERAFRIFGLPPERFTVVPNGVTDTEMRACTYATRGQPLVIGHVGTLSERKGWSIVGDAVGQMVEEGMHVKYIIAGHGPDEEKARHFAQSHASFVDFRGFVKNPRESVFPEMDILVTMSVREGLPMSIIEAMSMGIPTVATAVGGIPEAITSGENGVLISRDSQALGATLRELYANPAMLSEMSRSARRVFADRYEIQKILDIYETVYAKP